uniref:Isopentenyl-diphosphate Delta-isomerase n=1 Tax=Marinactinospora thermotolerans TaxID=531310 RepID=I7EGG1_9ACTN|nr:Isopentenyl-diphosphate delta-isomerase [Marinactinospora thermotolerans]
MVLVDDEGRPTGVAPKATVHTTDTPLHLAFSCYILGRQGRVLVTRRALAKRTWPGVWTNSCCGHPGPGEPTPAAVRRRVREELSLELSDLAEVLPDFRYRATAADGTVENEICPVYLARTDTDPVPAVAEVAEWRWVDWSELVTLAETAPWAVSPWAALQIPLLARAGVVGEP